MKNIHNIFFTGVLLIAAIFCSCDNEGGANKDYHLMQADTIISQYNADRPNWDRAVRLEGKVKITSAKNLITIQLEPDSSNEFFSYFLQIEEDETKSLNIPEGRAEVLYLERNLLVNSLDKKMVLSFKINSDKLPAYLENLGDVKEFVGYGLGLRKTEKGNSLEGGPLCSCIKTSGITMNCPNGGENEVSCGTGNTMGSCRVSCGGQAFACCDSKM